MHIYIYTCVEEKIHTWPVQPMPYSQTLPTFHSQGIAVNALQASSAKVLQPWHCSQPSTAKTFEPRLHSQCPTEQPGSCSQGTPKVWQPRSCSQRFTAKTLVPTPYSQSLAAKAYRQGRAAKAMQPRSHSHCFISKTLQPNSCSRGAAATALQPSSHCPKSSSPGSTDRTLGPNPHRQCLAAKASQPMSDSQGPTARAPQPRCSQALTAQNLAAKVLKPCSQGPAAKASPPAPDSQCLTGPNLAAQVLQPRHCTQILQPGRHSQGCTAKL